MSAITTHILDTSKGRPAAGVPVALDFCAADGTWLRLGEGTTDADGRLRSLLDASHTLRSGVYRLVFDTKTYFREQGRDGFYPEVVVAFVVDDASEHFHVPLLLNPFGYSTYRGS